jgi:DNA-binding MarR family transcriptional regulator
MALKRFDFGNSIFSFTYGFSRLQRTLCQRAGLYSGQPRVLTVLRDHEGCSLKELAESCAIGMPSLSVSVRNLEKAGLVRREGAVRSQRLYLTDEGRLRAQRFHQEIDEFYRGLLDDLGEDDAVRLQQLLGQVEDYIRRFHGDDDEEEADAH